MARYVSTKGPGASSGGSGFTAADACNTICTLSTSNPTTATAATPAIQQGFSEWEMLCNCPDWTDCYGCCIIWNIDTSRYRAYRLQYRGIRARACCYMYICPAFGNETCFCYCDQAYRGMCVCAWPYKSCCCWTAYNCRQMLINACVHCCNRQWDNAWCMQFTVCAPNWKGCTSGNQGGGIWYDFQYRKNPYDCSDYNFNGVDRQRGWNFCSCLFWSCKENPQSYLQQLCFKASDQAFMSTCYEGNYPPNEGGASMAGGPCWSIFAIPCYRPKFGTCSMTTA